MNHGIVFWIIAFAGYYAVIGALAWIIEKFVSIASATSAGKPDDRSFLRHCCSL
jgi:hypothetical protein